MNFEDNFKQSVEQSLLAKPAILSVAWKGEQRLLIAYRGLKNN